MKINRNIAFIFKKNPHVGAVIPVVVLRVDVSFRGNELPADFEMTFIRRPMQRRDPKKTD